MQNTNNEFLGRWGVSQRLRLRCCSAELLHTTSLTLPKMRELLGQRLRALVRSCLHLAQSETRPFGLEALLGWKVGRCRGHSTA